MADSTTTAAAEPTAPSWIPGPGVIAGDLGYLLAALPLGIVAFTVAVVGLSLSLGLAITLLGIPVLLGTLLACRGLADLERRRAGSVLGEPVRARERRWAGTLWQRSRAAATDPAAWLDLLWATLLLPIGIATFTISLTLWGTALGLLTSPAWYWALPDDDDATIPLIDDLGLGYSALRVLIGLALVPVAIAVCRGLAAGTARVARAILG